jgi:CRP/FNR family transcriptional regulator
MFCDLPEEALRASEVIKYASPYPRGTVLFVEGQPPRGIFVLCQGTAKLSIRVKDGTTRIVKLSEPGELT